MREQCFSWSCLASQRQRVSGCCSVEIIHKTAVVEVKNLCFGGSKGGAFFCLTQFEEQRTDGNVEREIQRECEREKDERQNMEA